MKNVLKLIWYYLKRCGMLLGVQLIMTVMGFVIMLIPNNIALIVLGIAVVLLNGFLFYLTGKSAALKDFKHKRINLAKFGGNTPYYESCKEMKLSKTIIAASVFYVVNLILVLIGSYADVLILRVLVGGEFFGIMLVSMGTGFWVAVNGVAYQAAVLNEETGAVITEAVQAVAGKPYLFPALFMPVIFAICVCYVAGYYFSARKRNKQHVEIQEEIAMFDRMGKA